MEGRLVFIQFSFLDIVKISYRLPFVIRVYRKFDFRLGAKCRKDRVKTLWVGFYLRKNVKNLANPSPNLVIGSDTLSKWQNLASQNVKEGFNVAEDEHNTSLDDDQSTVGETSEGELGSSSDELTKTTTKESSSRRPVIRKPLKPKQQSTPSEGKHSTSSFLKLDTPADTKRTIITRNSSALNSLRQGRKMLRGNKDKSGRSKAEVIDMIATAMNKANVETRAGQRILSSLSNSANPSPRRESIRQRAETLSKSPELQEMPTVSKILEKVATNNVQIMGLDSSDLESEIDDAPPPSPPNLPRPTKTELVRTELNSVTGPLGLLSRADLNEPNPLLRDRLLRLSSVDTTAPDPSKLANKPLDGIQQENKSNRSGGLAMRRNKSSGSLVEMMMTNKLNAGFRPMGLANIVNTGSMDGQSSSSVGLLGLVDTTTSQDIQTSKSVETGLDSVQKPDNNTTNGGGGGFGFFSSFLGKLS